MLLDARGLVLAPDAQGVEETLRRWLVDPEGARSLGQRAREAIQHSKGATERTLAILRPLLEALRQAGERARGAAPG
jgi:hypothetical protein